MHCLVYVVEAYDIEGVLDGYSNKFDYFQVGGAWDGEFILNEGFDQEDYDYHGIEIVEHEGNMVTNHAFSKDINREHMLLPYAVLTHHGEWLEDEEEINSYLDNGLEDNFILTIVDIHI